MPNTRHTDPASSHEAEQVARHVAEGHIKLIVRELQRKPRQTAFELAYASPLMGVLRYDQIAKRLSECAVKGKLRRCTTNIPTTKAVCEWLIADQPDKEPDLFSE